MYLKPTTSNVTREPVENAIDMDTSSAVRDIIPSCSVELTKSPQQNSAPEKNVENDEAKRIDDEADDDCIFISTPPNDNVEDDFIDVSYIKYLNLTYFF